MSADPCWLTKEVDAEVAVARFLADFTGQDRIAAIHLVLSQLRRRPLVRAAIAEVGLAKATLIVPAIERTGEWAAWVELARRLPAVTLQLRISEALQAQPRGREPLPPGERFRRSVLSAMPDIEAMEVVERFFEVGASVVGTDHPVGIFLAGCRECLADWEVHAEAQRKKRTNIPEHAVVAHVGNGEPQFSHPEFCPRGQNPRTSAC